ncbi:MAG: flagellar hook-basal body protein [Candidatus Melainabacteria bacterium]|nr:flagellar hook-basal body protein [Candidatus Melainabacteria bacterium]
MLQHIMTIAADNGNKQFMVLEQIAANVANLNTAGYKARRFEQYLFQDNRLEGIQRVDTTTGAPMRTGRELDIAIKGEGFIPVTQPDGKVAYTRDGSLTKNSDGYLMTQRGDLVGNGIQLPLNYKKLRIHPDGTVDVLIKDQQAPQVVGKIQLVRFANAEGLESIGNNKLVPTGNSGQPEPLTDVLLEQGAIERSNVNIHSQIDQILRLNASLISNFRIIKFTDDIFRQAVNLKQ